MLLAYLVGFGLSAFFYSFRVIEGYADERPDWVIYNYQAILYALSLSVVWPYHIIRALLKYAIEEIKDAIVSISESFYKPVKRWPVDPFDKYDPKNYADYKVKKYYYMVAWDGPSKKFNLMTYLVCAENVKEAALVALDFWNIEATEENLGNAIVTEIPAHHYISRMGTE